jgi:uncharacterized protein
MDHWTILWQRLDRTGLEACRLTGFESRWVLEGAVLFHQEGEPCRLDYLVACGADWRTLSCDVSGWLGPRDIKIRVDVDDRGRWLLDSEPIDGLGGAVDIDLNFSPSTNLLPIRRLKPEVGERASVKAAWLRFPSFRLEPLEQTYHRLDDSTYRYESAGGSFTRDLTVNEAGLVTFYPDFWQAI